MEIGIHFGVLSAPLSKQCRDQGYILRKGKYFQRCVNSVNCLYVGGFITDKERQKI